MPEIIKTDNPQIVIERTYIDKTINLKEICDERAMRIANLVKYREEKLDLNSVSYNHLIADLISNRQLELDDLIKFDEERINEINLTLPECQ